MEEVVKEVRGITELRNEVKQMRKEIDESIEGQGKMLREKIKEIKKGWKKQETKWKKKGRR